MECVHQENVLRVSNSSMMWLLLQIESNGIQIRLSFTHYVPGTQEVALAPFLHFPARSRTRLISSYSALLPILVLLVEKLVLSDRLLLLPLITFSCSTVVALRELLSVLICWLGSTVACNDLFYSSMGCLYITCKGCARKSSCNRVLIFLNLCSVLSGFARTTTTDRE